MIYVLAIIAAIVAAVVGYLVSATLGVVIAGWFGMSDFEGGRGMFAAFFVGPIGGFISMVVAAWLVLQRGEPAPLLPTIGRVGAVLAAIALIVTAGILTRLYTLDTYTNELPPRLEFELRVPGTMAVPQRAQVSVELHTDKNVGDGQLFDEWTPREGHRVITGSVELAFKTSSRILVVSFADQPNRLFRLPLSRNPSSTAALGEWHHADHIDVRGEEGPRKAPANDPVEVRYRVRRAGED